MPAKPQNPNPFIALTGAVQKVAEPRLRRIFAGRVKAAAKYGDEVAALVKSVRELVLRGGKRLRPALVAAGLRAADGRAPIERAIDLGLSLEMLHTYLLIHDDWMDGDSVRRGGPTVHRLLARRLGSEEQGAWAAVLAGDYTLGVALELFRQASQGARQSELLGAFTRMHEDAIFGQQLDITASSPDPELVYALKTGSYTVNGPLAMGALLGNGKPRLLSALERFSVPAGVAFQLRDDLLGAFGDPSVTGKPLGNDLVAGKQTLLVKSGLRRARGAARKRLTAVLGQKRATPADVGRALDVLEETGARHEVEGRITELCANARRALKSKVIGDGGRELLSGALTALAERPL
jgi:geranylgeranyl diphosphate synthase type I